MSLITEYPIWFIPCCLLLGAAYAYALYWKEERFEAEYKKLTWVLMGLRFISVSFLSFLLLGPFIKTLFIEVEKPIIIFAQDNSESILNDKDSLYYQITYAQEIEEMVSSLSKDYEVRTYSFGKEVQPGLDFKFDKKQTDLSVMFEELNTVYSNRNIGAVIVSTDGNYNQGMNPLYVNGIKELNAPVYTIALGDTSSRKDLVLSKVAHNRLAYLGNDFPLEIQIHAVRCEGEATEVTVTKKGKELFKEVLNIDANSYSQKILLELTAEESGIQHYKIEVKVLEGEVNAVNNVKDIYIDILDGRQKILLLSNAPHPDIGAISQAISINENYELKQIRLDKFLREKQLSVEALKAYNLIILHQIPARRKNIDRVLQTMLSSGVPMLFVLGSQSDIRGINALKLGMEISGGQNKMNEAQAVIQDQFSLFSVEELQGERFANLPPLQVPFGQYKLSKSASVLFTQKIGMVKTKHPLIAFMDRGNLKVGIIAGEGLWRWRLRNFEENGSHTPFNTLLSKIVQYLSVKDDKSNFKVFSKNSFLENEIISFDAEVYNVSYELINDPEIKLTIENEDGQSFPFTFSRTANAYKLDAGMLPIGTYTYSATVKVGAELYQEKGEFNISPIQVESATTRADHQLLYNLSAKYGGEMYVPGKLEELLKTLSERDDIVPISYAEERLKELINLKWIFFMLLVIVSLEWFFRKRAGVY